MAPAPRLPLSAPARSVAKKETPGERELRERQRRREVERSRSPDVQDQGAGPAVIGQPAAQYVLAPGSGNNSRQVSGASFDAQQMVSATSSDAQRMRKKPPELLHTTELATGPPAGWTQVAPNSPVPGFSVSSSGVPSTVAPERVPTAPAAPLTGRAGGRKGSRGSHIVSTPSDSRQSAAGAGQMDDLLRGKAIGPRNEKQRRGH